MGKITIVGEVGQGMSTKMFRKVEEYHRKGYKIFDIMNPLPMIPFSFKHMKIYSSNTFQTLRDVFYEILYKITKNPFYLSKLMECNN